MRQQPQLPRLRILPHFFSKNMSLSMSASSCSGCLLLKLFGIFALTYSHTHYMHSYVCVCVRVLNLLVNKVILSFIVDYSVEHDSPCDVASAWTLTYTNCSRSDTPDVMLSLSHDIVAVGSAHTSISYFI